MRELSQASEGIVEVLVIKYGGVHEHIRQSIAQARATGRISRPYSMGRTNPETMPASLPDDFAPSQTQEEATGAAQRWAQGREGRRAKEAPSALRPGPRPLEPEVPRPPGNVLEV